MNQSEARMKDWIFRYQTVFNMRHSKTQKDRFIRSFVNDVYQFRPDVEVRALTNEGEDLGNIIIVGNPKKANRVITSYYDTPKQHFGSYHFFQVDKQEKNTFNFIRLTAGLTFIIGLIAVLIFINFGSFQFDFRSLQTWVMCIATLGFFLLANKVSRGLGRRKNAVRNSSSILAVMELMFQLKNDNTAFILITNGIYGYAQIDLVKRVICPDADLYYLDSIGSKETLYLFGQSEKDETICQKLEIEFRQSKDSIHQFISASEESGEFFLSKEALNADEINWDNLEKVIAYFKGGN